MSSCVWSLRPRYGAFDSKRWIDNLLWALNGGPNRCPQCRCVFGRKGLAWHDAVMRDLSTFLVRAGLPADANTTRLGGLTNLNHLVDGR